MPAYLSAYQLDQLSFGHVSSLYPWAPFRGKSEASDPYGALEPLLNSWLGLIYPILYMGSARWWQSSQSTEGRTLAFLQIAHEFSSVPAGR